MSDENERSFLGLFKRRPKPSPVGATVFYGEANVRPVEPIGAQEAPDPVRQGDTFCRAARWPKIVYTNIPGILSIMQDEFGFPLFAPQHTAHYLLGPGAQLPWDERSNVETGRSEPYGSGFEIANERVDYNGDYAKLLN